MSDHNHETDGNPGWWIARPENANKVWTALIVACVGLTHIGDQLLLQVRILASQQQVPLIVRC